LSAAALLAMPAAGGDLAPAKPKAAASRTASSKAAPRRTSTRRRTASRARAAAQHAPSRERYTEIQQALAGRGYDPGAVDGQWGAKSTGALKQFEKDHGLPADGQLDSLTLITLGLGPRRDGGARGPAAEESGP
jgi:peptidoglycan hydrolase-like protein with peptidoglycan-binding domain